jgi:hypothetical protein
MDRNGIGFSDVIDVIPDADLAVAIEHDQIVVRVELSRLWLLFIPTFAAVAFLLARPLVAH